VGILGRVSRTVNPAGGDLGGEAMLLSDRIAGLDEELFESVESQTTGWDRRSLLALHSAFAERGDFSYLEIGSYLGGSLQVLVRDPRCTRIMSIDPRPVLSPDLRGPDWTYDGNSTENMIDLLGSVPDADLSKLSTFERGTDELFPTELPAHPDLCFIDGEHTDEAALRDARFCLEALGNSGGVIAFHDYPIVGGAIREFLREAWGEVSHAIAFTGFVFAVELGGGGLLRSEAVDRAIASRWHSLAWRAASRPRRSASAFLAAWSAVGPADAAIAWLKAVGRT
jgi:hypothetical protein